MQFKIIRNDLLAAFTEHVNISPVVALKGAPKAEIPVDYFQFYNSVSSVYSSKIEGENIDFDSFFKHKFLHVKYKPDYTKKADDLFAAYEFIYKADFTFENTIKAHGILSANLLPGNEQGHIRNNPMFVLNSEDRIEYVAANPSLVKTEMEKLFEDIRLLKNASLDDFEIFYYAAYIHLVFVKIHPFQDGNGRTARLLEKWFLLEQIGDPAVSVQLEKNYYNRRIDYYSNLRRLGLEYETLDYTKSLDFLMMTAKSTGGSDTGTL